jgi:DNA-binding transcriptional LysR family regulator
MDRMTSMATFVKVVETGGFSTAARALDMSPSMVTTHVQAIEERLGVRLLNRSTRKVGLTEVGQAYYERCVQILAELEDADKVAQALQSTPRGTLRLNISIVMPPLMGSVISDYVKLYPDVGVEMIISDRMVDLVEEGFDLSIRMTPVPDSSLIVRRLATYRLVVCGAPAYLAERGIPQTPADLTNHNCLIFSQSPWGDEWLFSGVGGDQRVKVSGNLRSNSAVALRLAALRGQGLLAAMSFQVVDDIKAGLLIPVLADFLPNDYPVLAVYPHRHQLSAKVRTFIDLLAKHFRDGPISVSSQASCVAA